MDNPKKRIEILIEADILYKSGKAFESARQLMDALSLYDEKERESSEYAVFCNSLGSALAESGQLSIARQFFHTALKIYQSNGDHENQALINFNLGNVYKYQNVWQGAINHYNTALEVYEKIDNKDGIVRSSLGILHFYNSLGVPEEITEPYITRLKNLESNVLGDPESAWSYSMIMSEIQDKKGDLPGAIETAKLARAHAHHLGNTSYIAETDSVLGNLLVRGNNLQSAREYLLGAYEIMKDSQDRRHYLTAFDLAKIEERLGNIEQAISLFEECISIIDQSRSQLDGVEKYLAMERESSLYRYFVEFLVKIHKHELAFEITERVQGRTLLDLMFRHQIKRQGGRTIRSGQKGRLILDSPLMPEIITSVHEENIHVIKFFFTADKLIGWFLKADGSLDVWDASKAIETVSVANSKLPTLSYFETSQAVSLSEDFISIEEIEVKEKAGKEIPSWTEIASILSHVYKAIFPPTVQEYLQVNRGQLVIIPHLQLFHIPFSSLGNRNDWIIGDNWQVAISPSIGAFLQQDLRREPNIADEEHDFQALVVGGVFPQTVAIPGGPILKDKYFIANFAALPGSLIEAKRIAQRFNEPPLTNEKANRENILERFAQADVLHFASHGVWDPIDAEKSFILLSPRSDGTTNILTAGEIKELSTNAQLVVLSACQTGLGREHPDSYIGLPQSFLIAGARSILVSLWPISDLATVFFMETFYDYLLKDHTIAEAFQKTQQTFKNSHRADGYIWAGFQLIGRPFYRLKPKPTKTPFSGPILCSGDVLWLNDKINIIFPLEEYVSFVQLPNEGALISNQGIHKILKPNTIKETDQK